MKLYKQIDKAERLEIGILLERGYSDAEIARVLGRDRSTIYRERKRNSVKAVYIPRKAQHKAYVRRKYAKYQAMCIVKDVKLREYIETKLLVDEWSPEQIAGRLALETNLAKVSAPTIYKYIRSPYGRQLEYELDLVKKKRRKSKAKRQRKVSALENRIFIDQRPKAASTRSQFGHWEADFIVSGKQYGSASLLVLHERVSRYTLIAKLTARTVSEVENAFIEALPFIGNFESLTLDNDIAFQKHTRLSKLIQAPIYFCKPYHSWEKGGVENANRLIRRDIPKGCDIARFTNQDIWNIQHKLNNRPRKVLGYKTAKEVFTYYQQQAIKDRQDNRDNQEGRDRRSCQGNWSCQDCRDCRQHRDRRDRQDNQYRRDRQSSAKAKTARIARTTRTAKRRHSMHSTLP
jgi:transposase for insertion sequence element IS4351